MLPIGEYFTSFLGRQFHDVGVAERKATSGISWLLAPVTDNHRMSDHRQESTTTILILLLLNLKQ